MIAMLFGPIWQKSDPETLETATMNVFQMNYGKYDVNSGELEIVSQRSVFYISFPVVLAAMVAIFSIFQFKNRLRQIQLGALNSLLLASAIGVSLFFVLKSEQLLAQEAQGVYEWGFYMPIIALLFNMMANRAIRRDEKLVRSADRIR